jgi:hypothetical protein
MSEQTAAKKYHQACQERFLFTIHGQNEAEIQAAFDHLGELVEGKNPRLKLALMLADKALKQGLFSEQELDAIKSHVIDNAKRKKKDV